MKKSFLSFILICALLFAALPLTAFAAPDELAAAGTQSGTTNNCTWSFDESAGVLTINGVGKMDMPIYWAWHYIDSSDKIKKVVFGEGITAVSAYAFYNCDKLKEISFPSTMKTIDDSAFCFCGFETVSFPDQLTEIGSSAFYGCNLLWKTPGQG